MGGCWEGGVSTLCAGAQHPAVSPARQVQCHRACPRGCEQPMVQASSAAPPRRDFGLFSSEMGGHLPGAWRSQSPVSHRTVAVECEAGESASLALGQRGHAVLLHGQGGDSV